MAASSCSIRMQTRSCVGDTNGWRDVFAREYGTLRNDLLVDFGGAVFTSG